MEQSAVEIAEMPENEQSEPQIGPKRQLKGQIFDALITAGMPPAQAHSIANGGKKTTPGGVRAAKRRNLFFQLAHPKRIRAAAQAVDETIAMLPVQAGNKVVVPTISNRLEAAKMVLDRADPIHQVVEHRQVSDYDPLDLDRFVLVPREAVIEGQVEAESEPTEQVPDE